MEQPPSAGIAAAENAWCEMAIDFGLYDDRKVARLVGGERIVGEWANDQREARKLLGIFRHNIYVYPGFQFRESGRVYQSVLDVLRDAPELDVSGEDVAQWFLLESPSLDGPRPVDVIENPDQVLAIFRGRFGAQG